MEDDHALNSPADGAMGRRGRRGSIPAPAFTGDKGATAGGRASAGNTGQARADGSPKPALVGANGVAATPKGSERRVLFSDEVQAGAGAATPNLLAQVLASPGKAFGRIFGMGRAEPAKTDLTPEEAKSLADLAERVHDETGLTLTDGWTVSIEQSGGKKTKRRTRFYSPGGRRFSSMSEAVTALRKQQTDADVKTIDGCLPGAAVNVKAVDAELWTSPRAKAKARRFVEEEEDPAPAAAASRDKAKAAAKDPTPVMSPRSSGRQTKKPEAFVAEPAPSPVELRGTKRVEDDEDDDEDEDEEEADDSEEEELVAPTQAAPPREDSDTDADSDEDEEEEAGAVTPAQERVADELDVLRARCAEHRELADVDIGDGWNVEWRVRSEGGKGKGKYRKRVRTHGHDGLMRRSLRFALQKTYNTYRANHFPLPLPSATKVQPERLASAPGSDQSSSSLPLYPALYASGRSVSIALYTCWGMTRLPVDEVWSTSSVTSAVRWCLSSTSFASGNCLTSRRNMSMVRWDRRRYRALAPAMVLFGIICTQVMFST